MKYIASIALIVSTAMAQLGSQCNSGSLQCCNTVGQASSGQVAQLLSLLNIPADGLTGVIGVECVPVLDAVNSQCQSSAACCGGSTNNGLVNVDCVPVNLNL